MPDPIRKPTAIEIVEKWLRDHKYDGLCTDDCGCSIDNGLQPCEGGMDYCRPGYEVVDPDDDRFTIISPTRRPRSEPLPQHINPAADDAEEDATMPHDGEEHADA
jgi:hypothetical protein